MKFSNWLALLSLLTLSACVPPQAVLNKTHAINPDVVMLEQTTDSITSGEHIKNELTRQLSPSLVVVDGPADTNETPVLTIAIGPLRRATYPGVGAIIVDSVLDSLINDPIDQWAEQHGWHSDSEGHSSDMIDRLIERKMHKNALDRLGYRPNLLTGQIHLQYQNQSFDRFVSGWDVMDAMKPLPTDKQTDETIREEEARALAKLIAKYLKETGNWTVNFIDLASNKAQ